MIGYYLGTFLTSLSFASAFVAMLSFFYAESSEDLNRKQWLRIGKISFGLHLAAVLGVIGTLFVLIYTHQYQYHYVWSHSSNELPVYYMISCFWEGQEGSFLLWSIWHSVLGGIVLFRNKKTEWTSLVMAVIAAVEMILSSMILGVYIPGFGVKAIYLLIFVLSGAWLGYRYYQQKNDLMWSGALQLGGAVLALLAAMLMLRGQDGFAQPWSLGQWFSSLDGFAFGMMLLAFWGFAIATLVYAWKANKIEKNIPGELLAGTFLLLGILGVSFFEISNWKIGSSPFLLLQQAFPNNSVFVDNPDFVPSNGSGLNTLLQNYWMVIHPPTIMMGFAAAIVPFAFVVAGLIKGKYTQWMRPAMPWLLFSVMILGVGVIMGGYWAYETLNFGGYWNWDPVENGSLVPWLCGLGALHALLIHKKTKSYTHLSMILVSLAFGLVLYSTFLTRSGILGETSVHTFTDLGLSGQLIFLVGAFFVGLMLLMTFRWRSIPSKSDKSNAWSAEFFLLIGILIFVFSGLIITLVTSLPVFNKIFGSSMAAPTPVQFFYYKWMVWFGIAFGFAAAIGQFMWWRMGKKKNILNALFRPFVLALITGTAIVIALMFSHKEFAYSANYEELIDPGLGGGGLMDTITWGLLSIADELLLFAGLFIVFAASDVFISMFRNNKNGIKSMGGSLAHLGFGLMLVGMLFSSGYDEVVSINRNPGEMLGFQSSESRRDNVRLDKGVPRLIDNYRVTYIGKKEAQTPIQSLRVIEEMPEAFKVRFEDATGDVFGLRMPRTFFLKKDSTHTAHPAADVKASMEGEIDMQFVRDFLNKNIHDIKPEHINNRHLFGIKFEPTEDKILEDTINMSLRTGINTQATFDSLSAGAWQQEVYTASLESHQENLDKFGIKEVLASWEVIRSRNGQQKDILIRAIQRKRVQQVIEGKEPFILYPEAEVNEDMKSIVAHPDRKVSFGKDLYVHVSQIPANTEEEPKYKLHNLYLKQRDTVSIGKSKIFFHSVSNLIDDVKPEDSLAIALSANIFVIHRNDTFVIHPSFLVGQDNQPRMVEEKLEQANLDFAFVRVYPKEEMFHFQVRERVNPIDDHIAFKAIHKPWINILWLGTFILTFGFLLSIYKRI